MVVCALTSNLERAKAPGNVMLSRGEGDLPKACVVNISQIVTVSKSRLIQKIGSLSRKRIREVLDGINLLLQPRDVD